MATSISTVTNKQAALDRIAQEIEMCVICRKDKIGLPVPGEGSPNAKVMFVGEAPGKQEAVTGRPFVGRSGQVLRQMIRGSGLHEEEVYVTSPVKYLPVHITPTPEEIRHGRSHLLQQIDIIEPHVIVLLGRVAVLAVLEEAVSVAKVHGKILERNGRSYLIAYHPAAVLYARRLEQEFKHDFDLLRQLIQKESA